MSLLPSKTAAIAGAGFCGLAVCYELLLRGWNVHLFDPKGIGNGASGVAAGLVHAFAGEHAKRSAEATEGMEATLTLLSVAEHELGHSIRTTGGIIRRAMTPTQMIDYSKCAEQYPAEASWNGTDLWIRDGLAVHTHLYLQGLWKACKRLGAVFHQKPLVEPVDADLVVWATGADMTDPSLRITRVRGQLLELKWPEGVPPLKQPLCSKVYAVMGLEGRTCVVGSTYERERTDDAPDIDFAAREILPKIFPLLPHLEGMPILSCRAGVRASAPGHRPLLKMLKPNTFAIGGMGSKGLLYHALYARKLVDNIGEV
jgi:glycine/D-amino acid oxidase-like deaminating enzyme